MAPVKLEGLPSPNVVGYVRVSSEEQAKGWSLGTQEAEIRRFCEQEGLRLVQLFTDPGRSGQAVSNRPGLLGMVRMVREGGFGAVIVWREDRLGRRIVDNQDIAHVVLAADCEIVTLNPFHRERVGDVLRPGLDLSQIQQILADYEWHTLRERILPNLARIPHGGSSRKGVACCHYRASRPRRTGA